MNSMFFNCYNLKELDLTSFDTSNVENMNSMFYCCFNLEKINLLSFNTLKVQNMKTNNIFKIKYY